MIPLSEERHAQLRTALGAYAVGALEPAERAEVDAHLSGCTECRDELSHLAALPGLLSRVTLDQLEDEPVTLPPGHVERVLGEVAVIERNRRHRLRAWRIAAAAAAVMAVALSVVLIPRPPAGEVYVGRAVTAEAEARAEALVVARDWGMAVDLEVTTLPPRPGYVLWAVADDGHRAHVASWTAVDASPLRIEGSCYVMADDVDRLEITGVDEQVVLTLQPT